MLKPGKKKTVRPDKVNKVLEYFQLKNLLKKGCNIKLAALTFKLLTKS